MIMIPHHTNNHYTLYVLNKYRDRIDILDSLNYVNYADLSWSQHHVHQEELVPRFKEVYEILLGEKFEKEKTRWDVEFLQGVPKVNKGETPFAVLRFAHLFDGNHFFEEIDNFDDGTKQWKAQQLCKLLFSDQNTIEPSEMGDEIRKIYDDITE
ncbi:hypothetical protein VPH35_080041 [Triticum aestivum]